MKAGKNGRERGTRKFRIASQPGDDERQRLAGTICCNSVGLRCFEGSYKVAYGCWIGCVGSDAPFIGSLTGNGERLSKVRVSNLRQPVAPVGWNRAFVTSLDRSLEKRTERFGTPEACQLLSGQPLQRL